jgi:hypothetical protein
VLSAVVSQTIMQIGEIHSLGKVWIFFHALT